MLYGLPSRSLHQSHQSPSPQQQASQFTTPTAQILLQQQKSAFASQNYDDPQQETSYHTIPQGAYESSFLSGAKTSPEKPSLPPGSSTPTADRPSLMTGYMDLSGELVRTMHDPMLAADILTQALASRNEQFNPRHMMSNGYVMNQVLDTVTRTYERETHPMEFHPTQTARYSSMEHITCFPVHGAPNIELLPPNIPGDLTSRSNQTSPFGPNVSSGARSTAVIRMSCNLGAKDRRPCDICGDISAGFHCNAYVCEACKKFFIRSSKGENFTKYTCTKAGVCEINKDTRTHCQRCRYQKCLRLGMVLPGAAVFPATDISEIPCRVCGAKSSGFHFGAITCEGCKGFFRRTINEREGQRYTCRNGGNCAVTGATRNNCKSCRYRRCLLVGMSKDGSRIGRQPNAVKHRCAIEIEQLRSAVSICSASQTSASVGKYFAPKATSCGGEFPGQSEPLRYQYHNSPSVQYNNNNTNNSGVPNANIVRLRNDQSEYSSLNDPESVYLQHFPRLQNSITQLPPYSPQRANPGSLGSLTQRETSLMHMSKLLAYQSSKRNIIPQSYPNQPSDFSAITSHHSGSDSPNVMLDHTQSKCGSEMSSGPYAPQESFLNPGAFESERPNMHYPTFGLIQLSQAAQLYSQQEKQRALQTEKPPNGSQSVLLMDEFPIGDRLGPALAYRPDDDNMKVENACNYTALRRGVMWKSRASYMPSPAKRSVIGEWDHCSFHDSNPTESNDRRTSDENASNVDPTVRRHSTPYHQTEFKAEPADDRYNRRCFPTHPSPRTQYDMTTFLFEGDNNRNSNESKGIAHSTTKSSGNTDYTLPAISTSSKHTLQGKTGTHADNPPPLLSMHSALPTSAYTLPMLTGQNIPQQNPSFLSTQQPHVSISKAFLNRYTSTFHRQDTGNGIRTSTCAGEPDRTITFDDSKSPNNLIMFQAPDGGSQSEATAYPANEGSDVIMAIAEPKILIGDPQIDRKTDCGNEDQTQASEHSQSMLRQLVDDGVLEQTDFCLHTGRTSANTFVNPHDLSLTNSMDNTTCQRTAAEDPERGGPQGNALSLESDAGFFRQVCTPITSNLHGVISQELNAEKNSNAELPYAQPASCENSPSLAKRPCEGQASSTIASNMSDPTTCPIDCQAVRRSELYSAVPASRVQPQAIAETMTDVIYSHLAYHGAMPLNLFTDRVVTAAKLLKNDQKTITSGIHSESLSAKCIWQRMMDRFEVQAHKVIQFARAVPGFRELSCTDMKTLVQESMYPITLVQSACQGSQDTEGNYFNFTSQDKDVILSQFPVFEPIVDHVNQIRTMLDLIRMDYVQVALFCCVQLFRGGRRKLEHPEKVHTMNRHAVAALENYERTHNGSDEHIKSMLDATYVLRRMNEDHQKAVERLHEERKDLTYPDLYTQMFQLDQPAERPGSASSPHSVSGEMQKHISNHRQE